MDSIEQFVAGQLAAWEVPGCAIAAVRDENVVLAAGWGRRDLGTGLPVTPDTLFAIGSTTKAFTAATVGALVDDGLLEWERPLRDYLPDLRLHDPVVTDRLTVVDLLSHRSGLPRHDLAWLGHPGRSRAELVRLPAPSTHVPPTWLLAQLSGGQLDGRAVMSPDTMARQHAPHMLVPEDRTFPASTRHAGGQQTSYWPESAAAMSSRMRAGGKCCS